MPLPFTKRTEAEKDVMDRYPPNTLSLVELLPWRLSLWCCIHLHCLNILTSSVVCCSVWGFLSLSCLLREVFKLCCSNWRLKFHDPPSSFVGLVAIGPWNVCSVVMVNCQKFGLCWFNLVLEAFLNTLYKQPCCSALYRSDLDANSQKTAVTV